MTQQQMEAAYNANVFQHNIMFFGFVVLILVVAVIAGAVLKRMHFGASKVEHEMELLREKTRSERLRHEREIASAQREHAEEVRAMRAEFSSFFSHFSGSTNEEPGFGFEDYTIGTTMGHPSNPKNRQVKKPSRRIGFDTPDRRHNTTGPNHSRKHR